MRNVSHHMNSPRKGHRFWFPLTVLILAAIGITSVSLMPELDRNLKGMTYMLAGLFGGLLTLLWFVFFSRFSLRPRLIVLALAVLAFIGFKSLVRVDGAVDGTGTPRFTWKWTKHQETTAKISAPGTADVKAPEGVKDVPQFYGPNRDGIILGAALARDWKASPPKLLWKQPIGLGWTAFSVVGGRAYTQEQRGDDELVTCYELASGKPVWTHENHVRFVEWQGGDGPRATPTVVGDRLFAMGATGILDCLDALTGKLVWSRDVLKENHAKNLTWGTSSSPLVYDDRVVVTAGEGDASILAFNKDTGAPLWKSGTDKASYSSPILATLAGKRVIVSLNSGSFTLSDAASGELLLQETWKPGTFPKAAQPVLLDGDRLFFTAGYGYGCVMVRIKANNGKLEVETLWTNNKLKAQFNSVAAREGHFYGLDDGSLACVDISDGTRKWKEGRFGSGQSLMVDDLILIQAEAGQVVLVEARADGYHELCRFDALSSKTWNHPVLAGRYLLVRNDREAMCFELPVSAGAR